MVGVDDLRTCSIYKKSTPVVGEIQVCLDSKQQLPRRARLDYEHASHGTISKPTSGEIL